MNPAVQTIIQKRVQMIAAADAVTIPAIALLLQPLLCHTAMV
jgi:hypothetical protein